MYYAKFSTDTNSDEPLNVFRAKDKSYIPIWYNEKVICITKRQAIKYKNDYRTGIIEC